MSVLWTPSCCDVFSFLYNSYGHPLHSSLSFLSTSSVPICSESSSIVEVDLSHNYKSQSCIWFPRPIWIDLIDMEYTKAQDIIWFSRQSWLRNRTPEQCRNKLISSYPQQFPDFTTSFSNNLKNYPVWIF